MIKNYGSSSISKAIFALLFSVLLLSLVLYVRQSNHYSVLLHEYHRLQTTYQEKALEVNKLRDDLRKRITLCTTDKQNHEIELKDCSKKSEDTRKEKERLDKEISNFEQQRVIIEKQISSAQDKLTISEQAAQDIRNNCDKEKKDLNIYLEACKEKLANANTNLNNQNKLANLKPNQTIGEPGAKKSPDVVKDNANVVKVEANVKNELIPGKDDTAS